ncbi:MAG: polymer-forming cytoskeletal protein [Bryobacteraceae bacterium]|nr:polymer-forming cytoskeletal protein [Bryobacteraceae bacterium]
MWNRRDEDRTQQRQPAQTHREPEPVRPAAAPATPTYSMPASPSNAAVIGPTVVIRGDIVAKEDLFINGTVEGTLQLEGNRLAVGPRGKVKAQIVAREVLIQGSVEGDIEAKDKITIKNDGTLVGDIQVAGIVIEDGAYFKGSIDIIRPTSGNAQKANEPKVVNTPVAS